MVCWFCVFVVFVDGLVGLFGSFVVWCWLFRAVAFGALAVPWVLACFACVVAWLALRLRVLCLGLWGPCSVRVCVLVAVCLLCLGFLLGWAFCVVCVCVFALWVLFVFGVVPVWFNSTLHILGFWLEAKYQQEPGTFLKAGAPEDHTLGRMCRCTDEATPPH